MGNNAEEIFVASNGHIYVAPVGTTAPTDATTALAAAFQDLGYVTEDGVSLAPGQTITDVFVWQEFYAVRRLPTAKTFEATFTLAQLSDATFTLAFGGGSTTGADPGPYTWTPATAGTLDQRAMVIEVIENTRIYRFYIPTGIVTQLGTVTFNKQSIVNLPVTFGATASGTDDPFTVFISDADFLAS